MTRWTAELHIWGTCCSVNISVTSICICGKSDVFFSSVGFILSISNASVIIFMSAIFCVICFDYLSFFTVNIWIEFFYFTNLPPVSTIFANQFLVSFVNPCKSDILSTRTAKIKLTRLGLTLDCLTFISSDSGIFFFESLNHVFPNTM